MKKSVHNIYIGTMVAIVVAVTIYLIYTGYSYYNTSLEERFYHPRHDWFKPSGAYGHGIGILGTLMILIGVVLYIARKRYNFLAKLIRLKYLLEFHIFLCTLGPILVLFHTAFKFGGIVSIAFWSMVAVVLSGVIGRFIYIQIPHSIEGRILTLGEVKDLKNNLTQKLKESFSLDDTLLAMVVGITDDDNIPHAKQSMKTLRKTLKEKQVPKQDRVSIMSMIKEEISLSSKIARLEYMQKLFKYWHVAHLPFALIMLIIVVIHVGVTLAFGYKWIF
ncbi:MAG: hypothetical protein AAF587_05685 [Bacteroidota bacterium]